MRLRVSLGDRRDPRREEHGKRAQGRETHSAGRRKFRPREIAARGGGIKRQVRGRNRPGVLAPAHQARDLVGFRQAVHPAFQAVLVAMLARTKIVARANPNSAQLLAAKQAGSRAHFPLNYREVISKLLEYMAGVSGDYRRLCASPNQCYQWSD
jgi:hypothetical protein